MMEKKKQDESSPRDQQDAGAVKDQNDIQKAHTEADKDIANDPEFSAHSPNDDLDEGETARLGEKTDLI